VSAEHALFALCLNPLLHCLDQGLKGLRINPRHRQSAVIAYADDITLLLTSPEDIEVVKDAIKCYGKSSGAALNIRKSHALAVGVWDTIPVMDIPYNEEITVLGVVIQKFIARAASASWTRITHMVRLQARDTYSRNLGLSQRIQYAHVYLMAKLWHMAQIYPAPTECVQQIVAAVAWFIWHGAIFRVPISTLQKNMSEGGWELTDVAAKCRALLITRIWIQSQSAGTIMSDLLKYWKIQTYTANPPDIRRIPIDLEHLRSYALDMAYIRPQPQTELPKAFRRRMYVTLCTIAQAGKSQQGMRITQLHPRTDWKQVWDNLHETWAPEPMKALWYKVIHDILPTNERHHKINLTNTPQCRECGDQDTILHRLTTSSRGRGIWIWTKTCLARILRTDPAHIPNEWLVRPHFHIWPPQKRRVTL
jgi:hypothetical protein